MKNLKRELIKELRIWLWYALISSIAAMYNYDRLMERIYASTDADINVFGMLGKMVERSLVPFLCVFTVLSAIRIGFICLRCLVRRKPS